MTNLEGAMGHLFWLSDEAWATIEPHLPKNQPGARRVDDRRVIGGILHVVKSGCRWRDCPAVYGPRTTIYNRFNHWSRRRELIDKLRGQDLDIGTPRKGDETGGRNHAIRSCFSSCTR